MLHSWKKTKRYKRLQWELAFSLPIKLRKLISQLNKEKHEQIRLEFKNFIEKVLADKKEKK